MSKILNLEKGLVDLDGEPIKISDRVLTVGRAIALILIGGQGVSADPLRNYTLAIACGAPLKETIALNNSDMTFIEEAVQKNAGYSDLVKGQVLLLLNEAPDETSG